MQPIKLLEKWLQQHATREHYLFKLHDLRGLFPELSEGAFKTLISRAAKHGVLEKICRGLYAYNSAIHSDGRLLFHAAAYLRSNQFNYISLETVLSDAGIISQIPISTISIMSSGRSNKINCGRYGLIEFTHTNQKSTDIDDQLTYDSNCGLWRASIKLALNDMKRTHRNKDLIDWDLANEFI